MSQTQAVALAAAATSLPSGEKQQWLQSLSVRNLITTSPEPEFWTMVTFVPHKTRWVPFEENAAQESLYVGSIWCPLVSHCWILLSETDMRCWGLVGEELTHTTHHWCFMIQ